jgi:pSer/pThr/pTyr-binding forkhead associated (FHA) protein
LGASETVIIRRTPPSFAYLFWVSGVRRGEHASLAAEGTTLGRGAEADVVLSDDTVSDEQARVRKEDDSWWLYDLASTNTTHVAGQPIYRHKLADGDRITLGTTEMVFRVLP